MDSSHCVMAAHESVSSRAHVFASPVHNAMQCVSVHGSWVLKGPPNTPLAACISITITYDPMILIPGGPGLLNWNLEWVGVGWSDAEFHFQVWQSLDKHEVFYPVPALLLPTLCKCLDQLLNFSKLCSSSSITMGIAS